LRFLVPLDEDAGLRSRLSAHFGRAPYLAVVEADDGQARLLDIVPNPAASGGRGGACGIMELLSSLGADGLIAKRVGVRAARRLLEAGVPVYEAASDSLEDVLADLSSGSLRPLDLASLAAGPCVGHGRGLGRGRESTAFYPPPPGPPPAWPPPMPPMPPPRPVAPRRPGGVPAPSGRLRVAFSTNGRAGLDDTVSDRFARCPTFTIVELDEGRVANVEVHDNPCVAYPHGAGFAAAQFLANLGVRMVVAASFGPNAWQALASLGMTVHTVPAGTRVRDALRSLPL